MAFVDLLVKTTFYKNKNREYGEGKPMTKGLHARMDINGVIFIDSNNDNKLNFGDKYVFQEKEGFINYY